MENRLDLDCIWLWFTTIPGIGPAYRKRLLDAFKHPFAVYAAGDKLLKEIVSQREAAAIIRSKDPDHVTKFMASLKRKGISFIHWESSDYPDRLRHIYDPPLSLYLIGRMPDPSKPSLAMVGSRRATAYGRRLGEEYASFLAVHGIQIISGLAAGIDAAGHRGALKSGAYTMGILGGGIDTLYPRENYQLYMQMYRQGGVLSEYPPGTENRSGLFPRRNRLISGMSDAVFVVEAGKKSGSLITADQGLEQGKDVFALPGRTTDPMSAGCNHLIAQGAQLVECPQDILYAFRIEEEEAYCPDKRRQSIKDPADRRLYDLLDEIHPISFEELMEKKLMDKEELFRRLLALEMKGAIRQVSQNYYIRIG